MSVSVCLSTCVSLSLELSLVLSLSRALSSSLSCGGLALRPSPSALVLFRGGVGFARIHGTYVLMPEASEDLNLPQGSLAVCLVLKGADFLDGDALLGQHIDSGAHHTIGTLANECDLAVALANTKGLVLDNGVLVFFTLVHHLAALQVVVWVVAPGVSVVLVLLLLLLLLRRAVLA